MRRNFPIIIIIVLVCAAFAYERNRSGNALNSQLAASGGQPHQWSFSEPKSGMSIQAFKTLCGQPTSEDVATTSVSDGQKSAFFKYHQSRERDKSKCSGMFSFMDDRLTAISR